ncbi:MAG: hypothetical protein ACLFWG_08295 [Longimicrobiales bacterium]
MGRSVGPGSTNASWLSQRVTWVPPFLVGLAGAAAGEMATGLLLYSTEGFLRALTVILVTELSALGLGFLTSRSVRPIDVDGLRRRWLVSILSFAAAAIFAGAWGMSPGSAIAPLVQGVGLGLLAALPLFSVGVVLGVLSSSGDDRETSIAAPASFGAALGLLLTGLYGVPSLQPASVYLFCVVAVSAAALLHGWIMDRRIRVLPLQGSGRRGLPARRAGSNGEGKIRWERRVRITPPADVVVLRIGGLVADAAAVARSSAGSGDEERDEMRVCLPWQRHVLGMIDGRARRGDEEDPSILVVGVGTGALLATLESRGYSRVVALEPRGPMAMPGKNGVDAVRRSETSIRRAWHEVEGEGGADGYGIVVVNLRLLPREGPFQAPDVSLLDRALAVRGDDGIALVGGVGVEEEEGIHRTLSWFSDRCGRPVALFRPEAGTWSWADEPWDDIVRSTGDGGGGLVTCDPDGRKE